MKIGVNLSYFRPGRIGGSEIYVRGLLNALASRDDVHLILFAAQDAAASFRPTLQLRTVVLSDDGISQTQRLWNENWRLRAALKRHPVDILFSPGNIAPVLLADRVPQVVTVHDLQHLAWPSNFSISTRLGRSFLFGASFRRCNTVIAISDFTRSEMIKHYHVPADKIVTVHNGVDKPLVPSPDLIALTRGRYRLPPTYLIFPAMVAPHKNHAILLRALARIRRDKGLDIHLALTGAQPEAYAPLHALATTLGIHDLVHPLGYLERSDVLSLVAGATALAFPSYYEGFGLPLLEAMHLGVPVLTSSAAALSEVAGDAALVIGPENLIEWSDAIHQLITTPSLRLRLIACGQRRVAQYSWERCATGTLHTFRRALLRSSPTPD